MTTRRKIEIFDSCILSVLRYGLRATWLGVAAMRRLDGFHARCLRKLLRIPPAYVSRISNSSVFTKASSKPFSSQLRRHQLLLWGSVAAEPDDSIIRETIFCAGSILPKEAAATRRVGRPRHTWANELHRIAVDIVGEEAVLHNMLVVHRDIDAWRNAVNRWSE